MPPRAFDLELLVAPGFVPTELGSVLDIVRIAGRHAGGPLFELRITSFAPGGSVPSMDGGLSAHTQSLSAPDSLPPPLPDILIVAGGRGVNDAPKPTLSRISRALQSGADVLLLSDAAKIWVSANHDQIEATTHWEDSITLIEGGATHATGTVLYREDGRLVTSAGMAATADTLLSLITRRISGGVAEQVARSLMLERIRPGHTPQHSRLSDLPRYYNPALRAALEFMEINLQEPIRSEDLERVSGMSVRQLERIFKQTMGDTPMQFLKSLRLRRARWLMETTAMPMIDIAVASGFQTASSFTKSFKQKYGFTPSQYRNSIARDGYVL